MNQNSGENVENEIGPLYFLMSVLTRESNNVNEYDVCVAMEAFVDRSSIVGAQKIGNIW